MIQDDGRMIDESWAVQYVDESDDDVAVSILEANAPVAGGEALDVTAELTNDGASTVTTNDGASTVTTDVALIVGEDPEDAAADSVTVDPGESVAVTVGCETPVVENGREFPVRVEGGDAADETTVLVHGTG